MSNLKVYCVCSFICDSLRNNEINCSLNISWTPPVKQLVLEFSLMGVFSLLIQPLCLLANSSSFPLILNVILKAVQFWELSTCSRLPCFLLSKFVDILIHDSPSWSTLFWGIYCNICLSSIILCTWVFSLFSCSSSKSVDFTFYNTSLFCWFSLVSLYMYVYWLIFVWFFSIPFLLF